MYTIANLIEIIEPLAFLTPDSEARFEELCFDSRKVSLPGKALFFAIKTDRNDGHLFIESLIRKGVRNFVITEPVSSFSVYSHCNFIQVDDVVHALQKLAEHHRSLFSYPVLGITGSNGKTIVKEWTAQVLAEDYHVVKSPNSYNSQIGVPLSVWQMKPEHTFGVFEAGISQPQEMENLEKIVKPTIGILTNVGDAHSRYFKNKTRKLQEKLKLFIHTEKLIYCSDDELLSRKLNEKSYEHLNKVSWAFSKKANYQISDKSTTRDGTSFLINGNSVKIPFIDAASIENAIQLVVLLFELGYSSEQVRNKMALLTPVAMRMEILEAQNQSVIINDTYSLDINSLRIALDFLLTQHQFSKKSIILSDFEQTDPLTRQEYDEIFQMLRQSAITRLIAVGENFYRHQHCFHFAEQFFFKTTQDLLDHIQELDFSQEILLVKGARSFHFEKIFELLQLRTHRTILNVNLPAIINNLNYFRTYLKPQTKMMAMVKAMSYGLGDAELVNELVYHNIDYLAVAYADEGVSLRMKNIKTPIIVLGAEAHSFETMIRFNLEPEIYNLCFLQQLEKALAKHPEIETFKIHLKIDTGMHRLGFAPEEIESILQRIMSNKVLKVASVFSHLAASEDSDEDEFTLSQIALFEKISDEIIKALGYPVLRHVLNSSGIVRFPKAQFEMVRLGLGLYGFTPLSSVKPFLHNTITLKTLVTQIKKLKKGDSVGYNRTFIAKKKMEVAVIPIGYADGYPLALSGGKGEVFVKDRRMPVLGKVSMDMTIIDVTGLDVEVGEEVIVYGDEVPLDEIARRIETTPYELLTSINKRVPRIYLKE